VRAEEEACKELNTDRECVCVRVCVFLILKSQLAIRFSVGRWTLVECMRVCACFRYSKVSSLLYLPCKKTAELIGFFSRFYLLLIGGAVAVCCSVVQARSS